MSLFDNPDYRWRETYFVYYSRETVPQFEKALGSVHKRIPGVSEVDVTRDNSGALQSVSLLFPTGASGVDLILSSPTDDAAPIDEANNMLDEIPDKRTQNILKRSDSRVDILHFEKTADKKPAFDLFGSDEDELMEEFDPSGLLILIDQLVKTSHGVAIDPQTGITL